MMDCSRRALAMWKLYQRGQDVRLSGYYMPSDVCLVMDSPKTEVSALSIIEF